MKNIYTTTLFLLTLIQGLVSFTQTSVAISNKCLTFNGNNSEVNFSNNNLNLDAGNTLTVTAWIKWNSATNVSPWANIVSLVNNTGSGDVGQFWFQHDQTNTKFEFAVQTVNNRTYIQSSITPLQGTWYHITGVYDGSFVTLYVNGVQQGKNVLTGTINNYQSNFKLTIGEWANSSNNYRRFNGDIDEVSIWKTALSQTQVRDMMCKSLKGNETGLIGYWPMNETSGITVFDLTSNARNGINSNATITESGAAIGNASSYTYGGSRLSLNHPVYKDSLVLDHFGAALLGIHIYRVDSVLNVTTAPTGYKNLLPYYYGVFLVNASGQTYQATYYYEGHPGVVNSTSLGLAARTMNSDLVWTDLAAVQNSINATLTKTGLTNRGEYIIDELDVSLPVNLLNFNAYAETSSIQVEWTTSSEKNNDFFTLEKSTDGINFEVAATVKGAGNSSVSHNYSYTDYSSVKGIVYYRLAQTDFDGKTHYFQIVSVGSESKNNFELVKTYPNPFQNFVSVDFISNSERQITIQIIGMDGIIIFQNTISGIKGYNSYSYEQASLLADGIYVMNISDETGFSMHTTIIK
jgi:hypothetical protein